MIIYIIEVEVETEDGNSHFEIQSNKAYFTTEQAQIDINIQEEEFKKEYERFPYLSSSHKRITELNIS